MSLLTSFQKNRVDYVKMLETKYRIAYPDSEIYIDSYKLFNFLKKYNLLEKNRFNAYFKRVIGYYKQAYPYIKPTFNHLISDKVYSHIIKTISSSDNFIFLPDNFSPYLFIESSSFLNDIPQVKVTSVEKEQIIRLAYLIVENSELVTYIPSTVIALEKVLVGFSKYLDKHVIKTLTEAHNILSGIRKYERDEKHIFRNLHFSKCLVKKQKIKIKTKGFTFFECCKILVNKKIRNIFVGEFLTNKEILDLIYKLKQYINKYWVYVDVFPEVKPMFYLTENEFSLVQKRLNRIFRLPFYMN